MKLPSKRLWDLQVALQTSDMLLPEDGQTLTEAIELAQVREAIRSTPAKIAEAIRA